MFFGLMRGLLGLGLMIIASDSLALSLDQAENIALKRSVVLKQRQAQKKAFQHLAVSQSQWQDPKIDISAMNFPTDSFSFNQEPMTQLKIGIQQQLPKGQNLILTRALFLAQEQKMDATLDLEKNNLLKRLRLAWAARYYWHQVNVILLKKQAAFAHLEKVTQSLYANNKVHQTDLLTAALQLSNIEKKRLDAKLAYQNSQSALARWLGPLNAKQGAALDKPDFRFSLSHKALEQRLKHHPLITQDNAEIKMRLAKVKIKKEAFKPDFGLALQFAHRQGKQNNQSRSDFLSLGVSMSLPVHAVNKQQKNYKASQEKLNAMRYLKQSHFEALQESLNVTYAQWLASDKALRLYHSRIIPNAKHQAEAYLVRYQNAKSDFNLLANSYVTLYQFQLEQEKTRYVHMKQTINLISLTG